jgi:uncharacterized membrane protein YkoI
MRPRLLIGSLVFASLLAAAAVADDDYIEARRLVESGQILPLEKVLDKIRSEIPGNVLEVSLKRAGERYIYEIEMLEPSGVVKEIEIDAANCEILHIGRED